MLSRGLGGFGRPVIDIDQRLQTPHGIVTNRDSSDLANGTIHSNMGRNDMADVLARAAPESLGRDLALSSGPGSRRTALSERRHRDKCRRLCAQNGQIQSSLCGASKWDFRCAIGCSMACKKVARQVRKGNKPGPKPVRVQPHRRSAPSKKCPK